MYGLSTRNVEKLIKLVLEKLAGIECDRLLKSTFSKYMLIEARGLVQFQLIVRRSCFSPRWKGQKRPFTSFDTSKSNDQFYVLGLPK